MDQQPSVASASTSNSAAGAIIETGAVNTFKSELGFFVQSKSPELAINDSDLVHAVHDNLQGKGGNFFTAPQPKAPGAGGDAQVVAAKDRAAALKVKANALKEKARKLAEDAEEKKRAAERARLAILRKERQRAMERERERERAREREREKERERETEREKENERKRQNEREREDERERENVIEMDWELDSEKEVDRNDQLHSLLTIAVGDPIDAAPAVEAVEVAGRSLDSVAEVQAAGEPEEKPSEDLPVSVAGPSPLHVQVPDRVLELRMDDELPEFPGGLGEKASPAEDAAAAAMLQISMLPSPLATPGAANGFSRLHGSQDKLVNLDEVPVTEGRTKRKRKPNRMYFDEDLSVDWNDFDSPRPAPGSEKGSGPSFSKVKKLKITFSKPATGASGKRPPSAKKFKSLALIKLKKPAVISPKQGKKAPAEKAPQTPEPDKAEEARCPVCQALRRSDCGAESAHPRCIKALEADPAAVQGGPNSKAAAVVLLAALKLKNGTSSEPWAASKLELAERVPVWEPQSQRRLVGREAPQVRNLGAWLLLHPGWEVLPRGELEKPAQPESAPPPVTLVPAPPREESKGWREAQPALSLLLQSWSSVRGRGDAVCFGSSQEAVDACRYLDPDFGPLCVLLNEGRYADVDALLTDFSRACDAVAVVRINDFKKGRYVSSPLYTSPARFVGAAATLIQHGSADLKGLVDASVEGRALRDPSLTVRSAYTNKEPVKTGPWRREPWPRSSLPALVDPTVASRPDKGAATGATRGTTLTFDVDVKAVDGWGIDPFTRRSILDALPKDPALEEAPIMSRAKAVEDFVSQKLLPALNERGASGWDIFESLKALALAAGRSGDASLVDVVTELAQKMMDTGPLWFKVHPKGTSLVCQRAGGLEPGTIVVTYPPKAVLSPRRWFELQEGLRKYRGEGQSASWSPNQVDFLLVERSAGDQDGYAVVFLDVRNREGLGTTPLLHSCQPTCQPVLRSGSPVVDIRTVQKVELGQELTLRYTCYTDSDDDVTKNVCLCGMPGCRGSCFVHLGRGPAAAVLDEAHSLPDRLALLLRAGSESVTEKDTAIVTAHGFAHVVLDQGETRTPPWLVKWCSLTLQYVEREQELLARALQAPEHGYSKSLAAAEAKQLLPLRKQHLYITLDRVRHCLAGQTSDAREKPPVRVLTEDEVCEYLWTGRRSVGRCLVGRLAPLLCADCTARGKERLKLAPHATPGCSALLRVLRTPPTASGGSLAPIKDALRQLAADITPFDSGVCVAARDLLRFLTSTETFVKLQRYAPVTSPPIAIPVDEVTSGPHPASDGPSSSAPPSTFVRPHIETHLSGGKAFWPQDSPSFASPSERTRRLMSLSVGGDLPSPLPSPLLKLQGGTSHERNATPLQGDTSHERNATTLQGGTSNAAESGLAGKRPEQPAESLEQTAGQPDTSDGKSSGGEGRHGAASGVNGDTERGLSDAPTQSGQAPEAGEDPQPASTVDGGVSSVRQFERTYPGEYVLAQLLFWHRNVPGANSVAAVVEGIRGTCLLPEPESVTRHMAPGERATWLEKLATDPGVVWPSPWRFKEDVMQVREKHSPAGPLSWIAHLKVYLYTQLRACRFRRVALSSTLAHSAFDGKKSIPQTTVSRRLSALQHVEMEGTTGSRKRSNTVKEIHILRTFTDLRPNQRGRQRRREPGEN